MQFYVHHTIVCSGSESNPKLQKAELLQTELKRQTLQRDFKVAVSDSSEL